MSDKLSMAREHVWGYAYHVLGFSVRPGTEVIVDEDYSAMDTKGNWSTIRKGSKGRVAAIKMLGHPDQLTIMVRVPVDKEQSAFLRVTYSERRKFPCFPLKSVVPVTVVESKAGGTTTTTTTPAADSADTTIPFSVADTKPCTGADLNPLDDYHGYCG